MGDNTLLTAVPLTDEDLDGTTGGSESVDTSKKHCHQCGKDSLRIDWKCGVCPECGASQW